MTVVHLPLDQTATCGVLGLDDVVPDLIRAGGYGAVLGALTERRPGSAADDLRETDRLLSTEYLRGSRGVAATRLQAAIG